MGLFLAPSTPVGGHPFTHHDFSASWNPKGLRGAQISQGTMEFRGIRSLFGAERAGSAPEPAPGGFGLGFEVGMALFWISFCFSFPFGLSLPTSPSWEHGIPWERGGAAAGASFFFLFPLFICILSQNHEVLWPVLVEEEEFWVDSSRFPLLWGGNHMEGREPRHSSDWTGGVRPQTLFSLTQNWVFSPQTHFLVPFGWRQRWGLI